MELKFGQQIQRAFNWLIPPRCIACQHILECYAQPFCSPCYEQLPFQSHCCDRCGQLFNAEQDYCGRCMASPPPFDACFCPFRYESPISDQIQKVKYGHRPELAGALARSLFLEIQANQLRMPDLLIPVPIHINRLRRRGFNQSHLLARKLARLLEIPYSNAVIKKHRATEAQVQQTLKQRQTNVRDSFRLGAPVSFASVAIIDDVFTTGATAAEITKILKRNGVDYVQVWGLAHTI